MKLIFSRQAYAKFTSYINNCDKEISGLGRCEMSQGQIYVKDIILLKQTVSAVTTNIDDDAQAKFLYQETKKGTIKEVCLWWHSHVDMGVFWSTTDTATIARSSNSNFMVSIVGNKKGEILGRLDLFSPFPMTLDITDITIDYHDQEIEDYCKEEILNKVNQWIWKPKTKKKSQNHNFKTPAQLLIPKKEDQLDIIINQVTGDKDNGAS